MRRTQTSPRRWRAKLSAACGLLLLAVSTHAQETTALDELSLEELTSLTVTTSARHPQKACDAAAAIFVLTQDDIRRSGASSLPQALRLVPGLQVAQIDASRWAISVRGFNSRLSNRVLVMIDGRTLYSALSGSVVWDSQDTMIEEVERIEVVRGPGGSMWGANAFNGVINIITKHTAQTGGLALSTEAGADGNGMAAIRYGDAEGAVKWRVFGKYLDAALNETKQDGAAGDYWRQSRIGARTDIELTEHDELRLNFEAYSGRAGVVLYEIDAVVEELGPPPDDLPTIATAERLDGGFVGSQFTHRFDNDSQLSVDASLQYYSRDSLLLDAYGSVGELNVQHVLPQWGAHRVALGVTARDTSDRVAQNAVWHLSREEAHTHKYGAFLQDEIYLLANRLQLTLGTKVEYTDDEGAGWMPNVRARYSFPSGPIVWAAASRALRRPSLIEHYGRFAGKGLAPGTPLNPLPAPVYMDMWGDEGMESEQNTAFEMGLRHQLTPTLSVDLALFRNDLEGMRGIGALLPPMCGPGQISIAADPQCIATAPYFTLPGVLTNVYEEKEYGGTLVVVYSPLPNWRLLGAYSRIEHNLANPSQQFGSLRSDARSFGGGYDPRGQASLRSSLRLGGDWELDAQLRYVDELPDGDIPAYTELNLRAAWRATRRLELALVGYNLLHDRHLEFTSDFFDMRPVWIERSIILQGRWTH